VKETVTITIEQDGKKAVATINIETINDETSMAATFDFNPPLTGGGNEPEWYEIFATKTLEMLQNM
jgi:hypothetical protein